MNRYVLLGIALSLASFGCSKDDADQKIISPFTGPIEYEIELGTGEEDDATGCLQMGMGNGEAAFGASTTRVDEEGNLTNSQCVLGIILIDDEPYLIAGTEHDVVLDDKRLAWQASEVKQIAEDGELELRVYENNDYEEGEPLFVGQLFIADLDLENLTAKIAAD
jgi:hypothetical protein